MKISVIVPVLNEQARIGDRLEELDQIEGIYDVIVVDGGSTDRTREIAEASAARLIISRPGRAAQMNAGAAEASGEVLLFLHADVSLPLDAATWIRETLSDPTVVAGAFRTWTVPDAGVQRRAYWLHLADLRSRYTKLPYGDQAMFVRADAFTKVGGFPEQPLMEDLELARRLEEVGRIVTVPACVRVSGRRFLARPVRDTVLVNVFPLLYRLGVPPQTLKRFYGDVR